MPPPIDGLMLQVHMPLLANNVRPGWTVSLVDTPGFGEENYHVQQLAKEAVETSAAYIYLLQSENIGGTTVGQAFHSLAIKDPGMYELCILKRFVTSYPTWKAWLCYHACQASRVDTIIMKEL